MDRRQQKTRAAVFTAFSALLSRKSYSRITVQEIIDEANVGRTTFYAHFETKDDLLKALCEELFGHIINSAMDCTHTHGLYSDGSAPGSVFCHLLQHLQENENNILELLSCESSEIFLRELADPAAVCWPKQDGKHRYPAGLPCQPHYGQLRGDGAVVDQRPNEANARGIRPIFPGSHCANPVRQYKQSKNEYK